MASSAPFFERLEQARTERKTVLCVGIDPRLDRLPPHVRKAAGDDVEVALSWFGHEILDRAAPHAACVKVQIGFFEAHGLAGLKAYVSILGEARRRGIPVIADVKRGDIGTTAEGYASAHLRPGSDLEADALTVNPYLGGDSLEPFVKVAAGTGKGVYVLVRTSNPGARDLQELVVAPDGRPLFEHVAAMVERIDARASGGGTPVLGAVVGATAPEAGRALRARMPRTPFLVPGYGAQGATAADVAACARPDGGGIVVNASRSIIDPEGGAADWRGAVVRAATAAKEELHGACARR
jgi:orotidine-5'-phosphate decarboxylase